MTEPRGPSLVPLARVERGGLTESWHLGAIVAVTPSRDIVFRVGGPAVATFFRSCAKPIQALPLIEAGGVEAFGLDAADLALICASHSGGPEHVERSRSLLERGGFGPEAMLCGTHAPFDQGYAADLAAAGEPPGELHNNCSGKHAGMLLACRLLDLPAAGYLAPEHPLQERILAEVEAFTGVEGRGIGLGIDGCGVPTFHLPLVSMAAAYAAFADPAMAGLGEARGTAAACLLAAMASAPEMVAGPGRLTLALPKATGGRLVGKEGAEGLYSVAVRGPVALGLAIKVADGSERARDGVVLETLRQIGVLSGREFRALEPFYRPELRNHAGRVVGRIVPSFEPRQESGSGTEG